MPCYLLEYLRFLLTEDLQVGQKVYEKFCHHNFDNEFDLETAAIYSYLPSHVETLSRYSSDIKQIRNWLGLILVNELATEHEALQKLPFLPDELQKISARIECYHSETAARIREIAELKARIINDDSLPLTETSLPAVAFPAVSRGHGARYVIWESFCPVTIEGNDNSLQPKSLLAKGFQNAVAMAGRICGNINAWHFSLSGKYNVPIKGASGSLALFAWLWLNSTGVELPCSVAFTGKVGSNGEVDSVGELAIKIRIALSCGFRYVVVPRVSLVRQAQEFAGDLRVVAVDSVYDLINWFLLHDSVSGVRQKLFGFIQGGVAESQLKSAEFGQALTRFIKKELLHGSWPDCCAQLINLTRTGKSDYRKRAILNDVLASGITSVIGAGKDERQKLEPVGRREWAQLFKSLVPESVYLLHLPILLDRYKKNHSIAAFAIYHELTARLFVQDLNISLAINWGEKLYKGLSDHKWFSTSLRKRFQFLSWYLFVDAFTALYYLVSWSKLTNTEEKWLNKLQIELVANLEKSKLEQIALPSFNWAQLSKEVLSGALSESFSGYLFNPGNVTSYDKIPMSIFQILTSDHSIRLNYATKSLLREVACRILEQSVQFSPDLRLNNSVIEKLKHDEIPEQKEISHITHSGLLECVRVVLLGQKEIKTKSNRNSGGWIASLCGSFEKRSVVSGSVDIYELDHALNDGLAALTKAKACCHKLSNGQHEAFRFQCLVNPALALVSLIADWHENYADVEAFEVSELFEVWAESINESMNAKTGFRMLLAKEIMYWLAGIVVANDYLPQINEPVKLSGRLSFRMGKLSARLGGNILDLREKDRADLAKSVKKRAFIDLLWLNLLDNCALKEELASVVCNCATERSNDSKNILLLAYIRGLWPECHAWCELPSIAIESAESLLAQFVRQPDGMFNNRSIVQGLLPFVFAQGGEKFDVNTLADMGTSLAASRGFSPLACCLLGNGVSARNPLVESSWWQLDWEREIYLSICAFRFFAEKNAVALEKLSENSFIDLKNMALICRLRNLLK